MENDQERFILAAIASSFVVDDVVCLENWKNRLISCAVDHMDYRLICVMKMENIKMESIRKLSNFDFQWTKTLYQNNLKHIAVFFTFFTGYRCT